MKIYCPHHTVPLELPGGHTSTTRYFCAECRTYWIIFQDPGPEGVVNTNAPGYKTVIEADKHLHGDT